MRHISILLLVGALLLGASQSRAALSAGAGADYFTGPQNQTVRDVLGYLEQTWSGVNLTVVGARYSSSQVGSGTSGTLVLGFPISTRFSMQVTGTRSLGEKGYRASRFLAGPVIPVGRGGTLGLSYARTEGTNGPSTKGIASELAVPVSPSLVALARGSLASVEGGGTNLQGSAGFVWGPMKRVLLVSELALGRDATALPAGGAGGFGVVGGDPGQGRSYVSGPAFLVGIRYVIH